MIGEGSTFRCRHSHTRQFPSFFHGGVPARTRPPHNDAESLRDDVMSHLLSRSPNLRRYLPDTRRRVSRPVNVNIQASDVRMATNKRTEKDILVKSAKSAKRSVQI